MTVSRNLRRGILWSGLAAAVFSLATLTFAPSAHAQEAELRLEIPESDIDVNAPPFAVDVVVNDVHNLGAFEFTLTYDPAILRFVDIERGPFLASSGRNVECLEPVVTSASVRLVCVTLGALPPEGAQGSGVLGTVTMAPVGPGTSVLRLSPAILARPNGEPIPATPQEAQVAVGTPDQTRPVTPAGEQTSTPPVGTTPVLQTPTQTPTQTSPESSGGGTNWQLWGPLTGAAGLVVVAAMGLAWWARSRRSRAK